MVQSADVRNNRHQWWWSETDQWNVFVYRSLLSEKRSFDCGRGYVTVMWPLPSLSQADLPKTEAGAEEQKEAAAQWEEDVNPTGSHMVHVFQVNSPEVLTRLVLRSHPSGRLENMTLYIISNSWCSFRVKQTIKHRMYRGGYYRVIDS